MTNQEKEAFLKSCGWHTWYNSKYWVHEKTIKDSTRQDYTSYGISLDDAYIFETQKKEAWNGQYLGLRW